MYAFLDRLPPDQRNFLLLQHEASGYEGRAYRANHAYRGADMAALSEPIGTAFAAVIEEGLAYCADGRDVNGFFAQIPIRLRHHLREQGLRRFSLPKKRAA